MTPMPRAFDCTMSFSTTEAWCTPKRRGRLVEDQHLGAEMDGARDGEALALAARQRADRLLGIAQLDAHVAAVRDRRCGWRSRRRTA